MGSLKPMPRAISVKYLLNSFATSPQLYNHSQIASRLWLSWTCYLRKVWWWARKTVFSLYHRHAVVQNISAVSVPLNLHIFSCFSIKIIILFICIFVFFLHFLTYFVYTAIYVVLVYVVLSSCREHCRGECFCFNGGLGISTFLSADIIGNS